MTLAHWTMRYMPSVFQPTSIGLMSGNGSHAVMMYGTHLR